MNDNNSASTQRGCDGFAVRALRLYEEGLTALQRGRRCTLTTAPLQTQEGLAVRKKQFSRSERAIKNDGKSTLQTSREALTACLPSPFREKTGAGRSRNSPKTARKSRRLRKKDEAVLLGKINEGDDPQ